jgi:UDP-N-acetyl-D-mannosaminuronate dehydrogenase
MISFIAGAGQIGNAVADNIAKTDKVYIYDWKVSEEMPIIQGVDIVHICFPCKDQGKFIKNVNQYILKYKPMHVLIWSTVPIGTTKRIRGAVHSPVEGVHPRLTSSIKQMARWIGANDRVEGEFFESYFKGLMIRPRIVNSSDFTEALKLLSTTEYGVNIEFARYKKQVADKIGMDYELAKEWNRDYNKLYHNLGIPWAQKYVLNAPQGAKGGHCVTPNARLLYEQFPDDLVGIVGEL